MLELNRKAEVSLHAQAADMEFTIERRGPNDWHLLIESVVSINPEAKQTKKFTLTDEQASATMALFIGELENNEVLNSELYKIAERVWGNVEQHFRPIP